MPNKTSLNPRTPVLTDLQYNFAVEYCKNGGNAKAAAIAAGYSKSYARIYGTTLVEHPLIKKKIEKAYSRIDEELEIKLSISIADKARELKAIIDDVMRPADGSEPQRRYYDQAMRAIDMLNKMQGHYAPNRSLSLTVTDTKEKLLEAKRVYDEY